MDAFPIAGGAVSAAAAFLAWAVRGRSAAVFGKSFWRGRSGRPALALTFDDGPSESTPEILEILAQHRVRATFFQVGANVDRLPEIARLVAAAGHTIGNHSYAHPLFCFRSPAFIEADLRRAQQAIHARTGVVSRWFRAPYGVRWFGMGAAQRQLSLTGVMWSAIGRDWRLNSAQVFDRLAKRASNGGILCLHDGRELKARPDITATVEAVRRMVPALLERGYELQTIDELLCPKS
ncbi:MAG TPA: polysaccharide deacetylase family protein [Bryobacteraceae bacterium]|nr:polysaccharide deacetylase family protein [Bryobacteraceae bacterium]